MTNYDLLVKQLSALLASERSFLANTSQFSAFIYNNIPDLNWAGFYFRVAEELVLGPFQGQVACVRIPMGKGVCGTAAEKQTTLVVDNVHDFDGHIACDAASNSEIVIPLEVEGEVVGVFDIDSPSLARFSTDDKVGLEQLLDIYRDATDFKSLAANVL